MIWCIEVLIISHSVDDGFGANDHADLFLLLLGFLF